MTTESESPTIDMKIIVIRIGPFIALAGVVSILRLFETRLFLCQIIYYVLLSFSKRMYELNNEI